MGVKYNSNFSDTNDTLYLSGSATVTTGGIEAKVGAEASTDRQFVTIYNSGASTVYFGPSGIAFTEMEPLRKKQRVHIAAQSGIAIILKTESGTGTVIIQEIG